MLETSQSTWIHVGRQAGKKKATLHNKNQTAERIIIINNNNNITDSLSKIQILQRFFAPV